MAVLTASAVAVDGLIAACGQAATPPATAPTAVPAAAAPTAAATQASANATPTAAPAAAAATGEKVVIKVFNRGHPVNEVVKGGADEYMASNPNVTVQWDSAPPGDDLRKMLVLAAAGTSPDIQWQCTPCDWLLYVHAGLVMDILPLVKAHNYDLSVQIPAAVAVPTVAGKMYGMPYFAHPGYPALIINTTMFEKAGVPVPKEDWTTGPHPGWKGWDYDAMHSAILALTKSQGGRVQQWGLQMNGAANTLNVILAAMRSDGADYLNKDGTKVTLNSPEGRKYIGYYADLYTKQHAAPITSDMPTGGPDLMASGLVAIRNAPTWAIETAQQTFKDFQWKVVPAPLGTVGVDAWAEANLFQIMNVTKQPDIAFDVLVKVIDPKWGWKSVDLGGIPGSQKEFWAPDSRLAKDPNWAIFAKYMNTVSPAVIPANGRYTEFDNAFIAETDPIWSGQQGLDANKLIDTITPKLQAIVDAKAPTIQEAAAPKTGMVPCDCTPSV
jgi:multiple sugar transport system substrate-binding protein